MIANKEEVFGATSTMAQIINQMKHEGPIKLPENVVVKNSINSGELLVNLLYIERATLYFFEYASLSMKGTVTKRENLISRENRYVFSGLIPGMKYQIKVGAGPANGRVEYSDIVEIVCE